MGLVRQLDAGPRKPSRTAFLLGSSAETFNLDVDVGKYDVIRNLIIRNSTGPGRAGQLRDLQTVPPSSRVRLTLFPKRAFVRRVAVPPFIVSYAVPKPVPPEHVFVLGKQSAPCNPPSGSSIQAKSSACQSNLQLLFSFLPAPLRNALGGCMCSCLCACPCMCTELRGNKPKGSERGKGYPCLVEGG